MAYEHISLPSCCERIRRYLPYLVAGTFVCGLALLSIYNEMRDDRWTELKRQEYQKVAENIDHFSSNVDHNVDNVLFLAHSPDIRNFLLGNERHRNDTIAELTELARIHESIRLYQFANPQGEVTFQLWSDQHEPENENVGMENTSACTSFQQALKLPEGEVFLSRINTPRDKDGNKLPVIPGIRISTPIYDREGQLHGVFFITFDASTMLHAAGAPGLYLFTSSGKLMAGPEAGHHWHFYSGETQDFTLPLSRLERILKHSPSGIVELENNLVTSELINKSAIVHDHNLPLQLEETWILAAIVEDVDTLLGLDTIRRAFLAGFAILVILLALTLHYVTTAYLRREEAERQLRESEARFRGIAATVPGVIFQWYQRNNGEQGFYYISPRALDLFDIEPEVALRDWTIIQIHPDDQMGFRETLAEAIETGEDAVFEGRILTSRNRTRWIRSVSRPIPRPGETVFNGVLIDVTDSKEAEVELNRARNNAERLGQQLLIVNQALNEKAEQLERLNQDKSVFLGIAAHDLRNPLTSITAFCAFIRESLHEREDQTETLDMVEQIEHSAAHMLDIIGGILDIEAIDSGQIRIRKEACDLKEIAEKVIATNRPTAQSKNITLEFNANGSMAAEADSSKIREVMENYVSNAIKYSQPDRRVQIELMQVDQNSAEPKIRFSVQDEGPGLTEGDKQQVFGRFKRLSAKPTGGEHSSGLGLSIAKKLIEMQGGYVGVESEKGVGSTFYFELPAHGANHRPDASSPPRPNDPNSGSEDQSDRIR